MYISKRTEEWIEHIMKEVMDDLTDLYEVAQHLDLRDGELKRVYSKHLEDMEDVSFESELLDIDRNDPDETEIGIVLILSMCGREIYKMFVYCNKEN